MPNIVAESHRLRQRFLPTPSRAPYVSPQSRPHRSVCYTSLMLPRLAFAIVICMSTLAAAQSLPVPQAVTDPAQLQSATVENLQKFSIPALYSTRQIGGSAWSPDATQVAFISNISGRNNLWTVPSTGGWPTQLTISDQRQASPAWSPDGKWIAYMSDKNGNELWNIFLVSPQSGEVTNLTASPDSADEAPAWSPDSHLVAYMTKAKTSPSFEIEIIDIASRLHHPRHPQLSAAARQRLAPLVARRQIASPTPRKTPAARIPTSFSTTSRPSPPPTSRPTPATRPFTPPPFRPTAKPC